MTFFKSFLLALVLTSCTSSQVYYDEHGLHDPENEMAMNNPPDGKEMADGVWGTDADEDGSKSLTSGHSVKFISGTPSANPRLIDIQYTPVEGDRSYVGQATFQADSTTGSNHVAYKVAFYDADKQWISTTTVFDAAVAVANTWETARSTFAAPSSARWARTTMEKTNTAFNAWFDRTDFQRAIPGWGVKLASDYSVSASVTTQIPWDTADFTTDVALDTGTGDITIEVSGVYSIISNAYFQSMVDQDRMVIATYIVRAAGGTDVNAGNVMFAGAAGHQSVIAAALEELFVGDKVSIRISHTSSASRNIFSGRSSQFRGFRVE